MKIVQEKRGSDSYSMGMKFLGQEDIFRSQSSNVVKLRIMGYLSKSKTATEAFPSALQVSFDCLYGRRRLLED